MCICLSENMLDYSCPVILSNSYNWEEQLDVSVSFIYFRIFSTTRGSFRLYILKHLFPHNKRLLVKKITRKDLYQLPGNFEWKAL